ncbi:MAG: hypothetical protein AAF591_08950 [Verrucomicrobiota bacterium]
MIIALVVLLLLSGGSSVDLSDPAVIAKIQQNVRSIVPDPNRARNVAAAAQELGVQSQALRQKTEADLQTARNLALDYATTPAEFTQALDQIDADALQTRRAMISAREKIRLNTTKSEWKKLLKSLKKDD